MRIKYLPKQQGELRENKYDAIVSASFACFIILKAAAMLDIKVPEQLGVISLDNEQYAPFLYPSLTTVDESLYEIAKRAAIILFENMNGDKVCKKLELSPYLSERESTAR